MSNRPYLNYDATTSLYKLLKILESLRFSQQSVDTTGFEARQSFSVKYRAYRR